jgi:hypothetical protein
VGPPSWQGNRTPFGSYNIDALHFAASLLLLALQQLSVILHESLLYDSNVALDVDLKLRAMTPHQPRPEACHNCRRQRLKCDRSLPQCLKCTRRGQECLGYQRLFRWERGVASRGKMAGMTFEEVTKDRAGHDNFSLHKPSPIHLANLYRQHEHASGSPLGSLADPLVQDVNLASRKYLFYCKLSSFAFSFNQ